ncbi:hypothetical protein [Candidatus Carsonella ruddii]|uniref:hypothetical protein n=1 Tax=Carsonella ruddii TaxID=114186 RepID=UPI003D9A6A0A
MNILNFYKFKKNICQNYLIYNLKFNFDLCSGYNYFNFYNNDIDFFKNKFINNKIYLFKNKNFYTNFLLFNFNIKKIININLPFNIIKIFIKKIKKINKFYFKIVINIENFLLFKKKNNIIKIKFFFKKIFFPYPKINILKIYFKKKINININFFLIIFKLNKIKSEKIKYFLKKTIILINKNVFFS